MALDNFEKIRDMLEFTNDSVYHIILMKRRKDGHRKSASVIKSYYVTTLEYFDKIRQEIIDKCNTYDCRAYINLNRKSILYSSHAFIRAIDASIEHSERELLKGRQITSTLPIYLYDGVIDSMGDNGKSGWFIDVDFDEGQTREDVALLIDEYIKCINDECEPYGDKVYAELASKHGAHIFFTKCNTSKFSSKYPDVVVQKTGPTNLYIPDSLIDGDNHAEN